MFARIFLFELAHLPPLIPRTPHLHIVQLETQLAQRDAEIDQLRGDVEVAQEQMVEMGEAQNERNVEVEKDLQEAQEALEEKQAEIQQLRGDMAEMENNKADDDEIMALKENIEVGLRWWGRKIIFLVSFTSRDQSAYTCHLLFVALLVVAQSCYPRSHIFLYFASFASTCCRPLKVNARS
jgi:hypothetical protein